MKNKNYKNIILLILASGILLFLVNFAACSKGSLVDSRKQSESEKGWIEIRVLDERTGEPIPRIGYTIKFDDGSERTGTTNDEGFLFEDDVPSDKYELILDEYEVIRGGDIYPFRRSNLK